MEFDEMQDNINRFIDIVKENHPNLMMNNELLNLIRSSFLAGYTTRDIELSHE